MTVTASALHMDDAHVGYLQPEYLRQRPAKHESRLRMRPDGQLAVVPDRDGSRRSQRSVHLKRTAN